MHELDDFNRLIQLDRTGMMARAGDRTAWVERARDAVEATLASAAPLSLWPDEANAASHPARLAIGLHLPPELLGLGRLCAHILDESDILVRTLPPHAGRAERFGLDLILSAHPHRLHFPLNRDRPETWRELDIAQHCRAADHPVQTLLFLCGLIGRAVERLQPEAARTIAARLDALSAHLRSEPGNTSACSVETPTPRNPAKQLAIRLLDRLPIFWGSGLNAALAEDWALRQQWYAERAAFALHIDDLARKMVMARLPGYWPNTAVFVQLGLPASHAEGLDEQAAQQITALLAKRRFVCLKSPASIDEQDNDEQPNSGPARVAAGLEMGEWLALYSAFLYHIDPADRVPLDLLFG